MEPAPFFWGNNFIIAQMGPNYNRAKRLLDPRFLFECKFLREGRDVRGRCRGWPYPWSSLFPGGPLSSNKQKSRCENRSEIFAVCRKTFRYGRKRLKSRRGARGGAARLEWDRMPRNALRSKVCGEQSEDFCATSGHKSNGIFQAVKKVPVFFDSLNAPARMSGGVLHSYFFNSFSGIFWSLNMEYRRTIKGIRAAKANRKSSVLADSVSIPI